MKIKQTYMLDMDDICTAVTFYINEKYTNSFKKGECTLDFIYDEKDILIGISIYEN